jgi:hypothetical protein
MTYIVNNKLPEFTRSMKNVMDDAMKEAASDGIRDAKDHAPFLHGDLRADSDVKKISNLKWRISFWAEYARFQEFGGDSKRKVKNYTWPGVGAHFLKNAGDEQVNKLKMIYKKHALRARA